MISNIISGIFLIIICLQAVLKKVYEYKNNEDLFAPKSNLEILVHVVQVHHLLGFLYGAGLIIQHLV